MPFTAERAVKGERRTPKANTKLAKEEFEENYQALLEQYDVNPDDYCFDLGVNLEDEADPGKPALYSEENKIIRKIIVRKRILKALPFLLVGCVFVFFSFYYPLHYASYIIKNGDPLGPILSLLYMICIVTFILKVTRALKEAPTSYEII